MGFFDKLMGKTETKKGIEIGAPVKGECVPLSEVSDPTFGEGILGKGIAIKPADGKIVAPADGTVGTIFPTGHAVTITTAEGVELLIHVGLDTVKLAGMHFTKCVSDGDKVKKGDLLLDVDIQKVKEAGYDIITPIVICNTDDYDEIAENICGQVDKGDMVLTIK